MGAGFYENSHRLKEGAILVYTRPGAKKLGLDVRLSGNLKFKDFWKRFYRTHEAGLSVHRRRLQRHRHHATVRSQYRTHPMDEGWYRERPDVAGYLQLRFRRHRQQYTSAGALTWNDYLIADGHIVAQRSYSTTPSVWGGST